MANRWRAWLRAIHRDVGYFSIGFTLIYAISGIAQNHIEEWGDVSYSSSERVVALAAPIDAALPDAAAYAKVEATVKMGTPTETYRAGDEIRLTFGNGEKVTVVGTQVTIQERSRRAFIGLANWLHTARHKPMWRYIADVYAVLLVYLAISGLLMIKGRLGWKWRGTIVTGAGLMVPVLFVALSGGPDAKNEKDDDDAEPKSSMPVLLRPATPAGSGSDDGSAMLKPLPPDDDDTPAAGSGSGSEDPNPGGAILKPLPPDDD